MCLNLNRKHLCFKRPKYLMRFLQTTISALYRREALPLRPEKDYYIKKETFIFLMYNLIRIVPPNLKSLQLEKKNRKVMSGKYFRRVTPIYFLGKCPKYTEGRNRTQMVLVD